MQYIFSKIFIHRLIGYFSQNPWFKQIEIKVSYVSHIILYLEKIIKQFNQLAVNAARVTSIMSWSKWKVT